MARPKWPAGRKGPRLSRAPVCRSFRSGTQGKDVDFVEMSREFATKSGLNEQVFRDFDERCGTLALTRVLDRVFERINNR